MPSTRSATQVVAAGRRTDGGARGGGRRGIFRISTPNNKALTKGRRTGIRIKPVGSIPIDESTGLEDIDAFWAEEAEDHDARSTPGTDDLNAKNRRVRSKVGNDDSHRRRSKRNGCGDESNGSKSTDADGGVERVTPKFDYRGAVWTSGRRDNDQDQGNGTPRQLSSRGDTSGVQQLHMRTPVYQGRSGSKASADLSGVSIGTVTQSVDEDDNSINESDIDDDSEDATSREDRMNIGSEVDTGILNEKDSSLVPPHGPRKEYVQSPTDVSASASAHSETSSTKRFVTVRSDRSAITSPAVSALTSASPSPPGQKEGENDALSLQNDVDEDRNVSVVLDHHGRDKGNHSSNHTATAFNGTDEEEEIAAVGFSMRDRRENALDKLLDEDEKSRCEAENSVATQVGLGKGPRGSLSPTDDSLFSSTKIGEETSPVAQLGVEDATTSSAIAFRHSKPVDNEVVSPASSNIATKEDISFLARSKKSTDASPTKMGSTPQLEVSDEQSTTYHTSPTLRNIPGHGGHEENDSAPLAIGDTSVEPSGTDAGVSAATCRQVSSERVATEEDAAHSKSSEYSNQRENKGENETSSLNRKNASDAKTANVDKAEVTTNSGGDREEDAGPRGQSLMDGDGREEQVALLAQRKISSSSAGFATLRGTQTLPPIIEETGAEEEKKKPTVVPRSKDDESFVREDGGCQEYEDDDGGIGFQPTDDDEEHSSDDVEIDPRSSDPPCKEPLKPDEQGKPEDVQGPAVESNEREGPADDDDDGGGEVRMSVCTDVETKDGVEVVGAERRSDLELEAGIDLESQVVTEVEADVNETESEKVETQPESTSRKESKTFSSSPGSPDRKSSRKTISRKKRRKKMAKGVARLSTRSISTNPFTSPPASRVGNNDGQYEYVPVSDYKDTPQGEREGLRRSKRAKFPPLKFWKNEHLIFEANNRRNTLYEICDMPVVTGVYHAVPTPQTTNRKAKPSRRGDDKKRKKGDVTDEDSDHSVEPFDNRHVRKKFNVLDGNEALVWDEERREPRKKKVVSYAAKMQSTELPKTTERSKGESDVVGFASQAFNVPAINGRIPGWISGQLTLPPRGIKDAEGVGLCSQVFFVGDCQPGAFEVAISDPESNDFDSNTAQRFLLSKGDFFCVPPNNVYRVENHSNAMSCKLYWTIIRPTEDS